MSPGLSNLDWLYYLLAGILGAGGVLLLGWALFRDRSRARRRCPKCWYSMDGTPANVEADGSTSFLCPECGRRTRNERALLRTRRRWRWAFLALAMVLGAAATGMTPKIRREGWNIISTRQLVELVPIGGYDGPFGRELMRRLGMTGPRSWVFPTPASREDLAYVAKRLGEGNWLARPMSARWKRSFGRVIQESSSVAFVLRGGEFGFPEVESAARTWYSLPPVTSFRTRTRWPTGYKLWVEASSTTYWPWPTTLEIEVRRAGAQGDFRSIWPVDGWTCKECDAGTGVLQFDVKLLQLRQGDMPNGVSEMPRTDLGTHRVEIPYTIGGSIDDVMTPVQSKALDDIVASIKYQVGPGWSNAGVGDVRGGAAAGVAFGALFEFRLDGELVAIERRWWDGTAPGSGGDNGGSEWVKVDPAPAHHKSPWSATPEEHWTITVKSDPESALRLIDRDKYWKGEVQIPLIVRAR